MIKADSRLAGTTQIVVKSVDGRVLEPPYCDFVEIAIDDTKPGTEVGFTEGVTHWGSLGYQHLGNARYWWAIAEKSGVIDPISELTKKTRIRKPSLVEFNFLMLQD